MHICRVAWLAFFLSWNIILSGKYVAKQALQKKGEETMLFARNEKGQGLVEYALILVLVAVVVIAVLLILGPIIGNVFTKINSNLVTR